MSFQPKESFSFRSTPKNSQQEFPEKREGEPGLDRMIDQIAQAVRQKLLEQGVPLAHTPSAVPDGPGSWSQKMEKALHLGADRVGHCGESPFQPHLLNENRDLASRIDHTLLKPDATEDDIRRVCKEAVEYHFATVCLNSSHIALASRLLAGSSVKPIAVVGFPLGAASTAAKAYETREAIANGAREIDMVINIGALKSADYKTVLEDIRAVIEASAPYPVKVILETSSLDDEHKVIACALSKAAGAAFVKTSTGFGSGGATVSDIQLMRRVVGPQMGVKASGGIRSYEDASKMLEAGATRIGASASVEIVTHKTSPASSGEKSEKKSYKSGLY